MKDLKIVDLRDIPEPKKHTRWGRWRFIERNNTLAYRHEDGSCPYYIDLDEMRTSAQKRDSSGCAVDAHSHRCCRRNRVGPFARAAGNENGRFLEGLGRNSGSAVDLIGASGTRILRKRASA